MEDYLQQFKSETNLYNFVIIGSFLPSEIWEYLPHCIRTWLRNFTAGTIIYFITASFWCFYIYYLKPDVYISRGLALHPLDGILQGTPHLITLFIVPMHFTTHLAIWFFGALWTANIHDSINGKFWPIMAGAGYHIVHHTSYKHNYGLYTIFMDWVFGTLCEPKSAETITKKQI